VIPGDRRRVCDHGQVRRRRGHVKAERTNRTRKCEKGQAGRDPKSKKGGGKRLIPLPAPGAPWPLAKRRPRCGLRTPARTSGGCTSLTVTGTTAGKSSSRSPTRYTRRDPSSCSLIAARTSRAGSAGDCTSRSTALRVPEGGRSATGSSTSTGIESHRRGTVRHSEADRICGGLQGTEPAIAVPAVLVGSWPEPFLHGCQGKRYRPRSHARERRPCKGVERAEAAGSGLLQDEADRGRHPQAWWSAWSVILRGGMMGDASSRRSGPAAASRPLSRGGCEERDSNANSKLSPPSLGKGGGYDCRAERVGRRSDNMGVTRKQMQRVCRAAARTWFGAALRLRNTTRSPPTARDDRGAAK